MIPLKDDVPSRTFPFVTIGIIILNVLVYLYQASLGYHGQEIFVRQMGAIPFEITHIIDIDPRSSVPIPLTVLTYMFMHGGFLHLLGNMLYLWIFGDNVEDSLGHIRFVLFYLFCGVMAALIHILSDVNSLSPMVGASGAIAGVLGAYFLLYPKANVLTLVIFFLFIRTIKIPAILFLGLWFLIQILNIGSASPVAWYAHIGGFICGILFIAFFIPKGKTRYYP
ncbi:MAG TPA: rhomboid family intramembrane serine protease [Syntrophaceae bacterium]|nr:rhomboid family intramembrane serine protease [Syntrophaceae bacterium]